jgi:hypothetical protein
MRHWTSAHAEKTRTEQLPHCRRQELSARSAARCLLVSVREVAPRTDVRSLVARVETSDQIEAACVVHAGPSRVGIVHRDWLGDPGLPAVRLKQECPVGKPILHPAGPQRAGRPGRRPTPADVALSGSSLGSATSALCWCEPEAASPGAGRGITGERERHHGRGGP